MPRLLRGWMRRQLRDLDPGPRERDVHDGDTP
jgi:hypothetical protein